MSTFIKNSTDVTPECESREFVDNERTIEQLNSETLKEIRQHIYDLNEAVRKSDDSRIKKSKKPPHSPLGISF